MRSIHEDGHDSHLSKCIHRAFHEIDEKIDWYQKEKTDIVSDVISLWEDWKEKNLKRSDGTSYKFEE